MSDIQYKVGEETFTKPRMIKLAARAGVTFEEFVTNTGAVIGPGKTTDSTITNPTVESGNTELDGGNGSLDFLGPIQGIKFDKETGSYVQGNQEANLFNQDEEEGVKALSKLYEGTNLVFEEDNFNKVSTEEYRDEDGEAKLEFDPFAFNMFDVAKVSIPGVEETIQLQLDTDNPSVYAMNLKRLKDYSEKYKSFLNAPSGNVDDIKRLKDWQNNNQSIKDAKEKASEDYLRNQSLFVERTETRTIGYASPGGTAVKKDYEVIIKPHEKELRAAAVALKKMYPDLSDTELTANTQRIVRNQLYQAEVVNAKLAASEDAIAKGVVSQEQMYSASYFIEKEQGAKYNLATKKLDIIADNKKDLNNVIEILNQETFTEEDNNAVLDWGARNGMAIDPEAEIVTLTTGQRVPSSFIDVAGQVNSTVQAQELLYRNTTKEQDDAISEFDDAALVSTSAGKNYDLHEKYLTNIGIGSLDLAVGGGILLGSAGTGLYGLATDDYGAYEDVTKHGADYSEYSQKIRAQYQRDISFSDGFSSAGNFGKFLAQEVSNQIPILLAMAASGGTAAPYVIGATSAGSQMMDMQSEMAMGLELNSDGEPKYSQTEVWLKSLGVGAAEGVFAGLTTVPILQRANKAWLNTSKNQLLRNNVSSFVKSYDKKGIVFEGLLEMAGETATTGVQNLITERPFTEGMDHAGFSGFGFGFAFAGMPFLKGAYNARFTSYENLSKTRGLQNEINKLGKSYASATTDNLRAKLKNLIEEKSVDLATEISTQEDLINNNLTSRGAQFVIDNIDQQASLQREAKSIQEDTDLSAPIKKARLKELQVKFDKLVTIKGSALQQGSLLKNETEWKAFESQDPTKYKEYINAATGELYGEKNGKDSSEKDISNRAYDLYYGDLARTENLKQAGKKGAFDGKNFKSFETVAEATTYVDSREDLTPEQKAKINEGLANGNDGVAVQKTAKNPKGVTLAVVENQVANQRKYTRTHEVGHQAFWSIFSNQKNEGAFQAISNQLLKTLKSTDPKVYAELLNDSVYVDGELDPSEVISKVLEYVAGNKITSAKKAKGIAGLFGVMTQQQFGSEFDFDFRGETDIFNFVVGIANKINSGELSTEDIQAAKKSALVKKFEAIEGTKATNESETKIAASLTPLQEINGLVPPSVETQEQYFARNIFNPVFAATQPNGVISNYIKSKSPSKEVGEKAIKNIRDRIINYDPAALRKKSGNKAPITFGEFIFANTNFIKLDAKKALFKESEDAKKTTNLDTKEAQGKLAEDDVVKKDRPKFRKLIDSSVLPGFTIREIGGKLTKVLKVLKSKLDTKVSINKSVSPLIAEIKKAMGKQADIDLKEAMGGKADAKLQKWLLKNKKAVLENMTTTWLMGAIPQAIQKSVGGTYKVDDTGTRVKDSYGDFIFTPNFTSDWQGKTIDREKTSTNKSGKTAGGDIVRRLPNIATALSDADFVGSVLQDVSIDADGKMSSGAPIRGKKESMAKAIAEEISLEVFNKELQNDNSEISKAFENNQAALGVVLADAFVEDIARQSERGQVKFSSVSPLFKQSASKLLRKSLDIGFDEVVDIDGNILLDDEIYKGKAFEGVGKSIRDAFDQGLLLDGKDLRFLQSIKASKVIPQSVKDLVKRAITSKSDISARKALAKDMKVVANVLGSDVTNIIGYDGLGFFNRLLDSAATKKDKETGKIIPGATGPFYDFLVELKENQPKSKNLPPELILNEVSPMNSKTGVMGKVSRILNKEWTGDKKREEYRKLIPEIEAANVQNKILGNYIITTLVNLVKDGSISPQSFISILQAQTNATAGLRSLTGLKYITFKDGAQGNMKGEHLADNGTSMFEIAELGFENNTDKELAFKVNEIMEFHDQWLENRETLDFVDVFGKANPYKDLRIYLLSKVDQSFVYTYDLRPAKELIDSRSEAIKSQINFSEAIDFKKLKTVETQQKAINNARSIKWSQSPKKIRVFDFDDTLARTKSNVLYTMPGETAIYHGGSISSIKNITGSFVYFSQDQSQASEYAKGNDGEVNGFVLNESDIASEEDVFKVIRELGIQPKEKGWTVDDSRLYELIDDRFEQSFSKSDLNKLTKALASKGVKASRFTDSDLKSGKDTDNIVVFDKKSIKEQSKIDAATFAKDAGKMEAEGAQWDFSEFSKVMDGEKGPLFEVAKIIADKRGTKDVFVLTARPADAAGPIQEFLSELGLDIPLENITGLGNGAPKAKADWVVNKVADGYNDFYFADDHTGNVKAVKDALDTFDVKGKVQLAKVKFSKGLDAGFNDMIQRQKGVESFKEFSKATAKRRGKKTGKWKFFISPSAEDFRGLTQYKFAGKGKQGEIDQKFFEESLMDPYFQGVAALESARQAIKDDTKALLKMFKPVKKKLNKLIPNEQYTYDAAVRVYLWNKAGNEIPGLSKRDNKKLNDLVANDPELSAFADGLLLVSKKDSWPEPGEHWLAQTTLSDLNNLTEKTNRKEYLTEFIENVDTIFSEKNLNKVEALYGEASRDAIENAISAMKSGSNSANQGGDAITSKWTQWVNNSIGTIMFFNRRSAILQTLSSANFINWSDNNPAKAALAFANQPQYWKDFAMIFNSDKLKQRRGGLKSDVQEAEIANAAKNTQDKAGAIVAYILKLGFTPTQIADSFAISLGGASLYRNRVKTYTKQGMGLKDAEAKAFLDFTKLSDEAQQSGDPALVSQQQRSVAGRLILSFQNTTMQYTRLMKKSGQDIINGRGDAKTHVSKIIYYGAIQNFLFNALSQTAFALIPGFDEEEEDEDEKRDEALETKAAKILNGMSDSVVRGTGIYGAIITTLKNSFLTWERENKKGFTGDQTKTIIELANLSPAIGSKLRKVYSGIQTNQFDKDVIAKHPWSVTIDGKFNPSSTYTIIANLSSAAFNLPLDRALTEARGVAEMLDDRNSVFQRIALGAGWRVWNVGAKNEEFDLIKAEGKIVRKKEGKEKAKKTRAKNKEKEKQRVANLSPAERLKEKNAKAKKRKEAALARKQKKQETIKKTSDSMSVLIKAYKLKQAKLKNKK